MKLIERASFISTLHTLINNVAGGEGHCVFISGEAGMGKTSLVKEFCKELKKEYSIFRGTCDALFTPRPLAPLYDIAWQIKSDFWQVIGDIGDRAGLFALFFHELSSHDKTCVIVFEDIHWADEATLDFIIFLARRITQVRCLFILTYRDDDIQSRRPLTNVLGHLPPDSFTRLKLMPLSKEAVYELAEQKGYKGEDVYNISGGNPFYVNELLASYIHTVPDSIRDAILSAYNRSEERTRQIWDLLSVVPDSFETRYLEKFEPLYAAAVETCVELNILIIRDGMISFKHAAVQANDRNIPVADEKSFDE